MSRESEPIGAVLNGLEIVPLDAGDTPLETVAMVRYMDAEGQTGWALRKTSGVSEVEVIGALRVMLNHEEAAYEAGWVPDTDDA